MSRALGWGGFKWDLTPGGFFIKKLLFLVGGIVNQLTLALDEYVVFDLETTGLSAWGGDEMIEIGAMKIFGNELDEKDYFHSLVNPKRLIPAQATNIHGITNEMVKDAPSIEEIFPKFLDFVGSASLVAQNAKFDMSFVTKYMMKFNTKKDLEVYDTMTFSRRAFPNESRHNLDIIAKRLKLKIAAADRHRSMGDVKLTAQAFLKMKDHLGEKCPSPEKWAI